MQLMAVLKASPAPSFLAATSLAALYSAPVFAFQESSSPLGALALVRLSYASRMSFVSASLVLPVANFLHSGSSPLGARWNFFITALISSGFLSSFFSSATLTPTRLTASAASNQYFAVRISAVPLVEVVGSTLSVATRRERTPLYSTTVRARLFEGVAPGAASSGR